MCEININRNKYVGEISVQRKVPASGRYIGTPRVLILIPNYKQITRLASGQLTCQRDTVTMS